VERHQAEADRGLAARRLGEAEPGEVLHRQHPPARNGLGRLAGEDQPRGIPLRRAEGRELLQPPLHVVGPLILGGGGRKPKLTVPPFHAQPLVSPSEAACPAGVTVRQG
jgi:hypothetical protein